MLATSLFEIAFMGFDEAICYQDSDKSIRSQLVRFTAMSQGTKQTTGKTTMMSMAGSEMHPFYLLGFADGWVHKSNLHYIKERKVGKLRCGINKLGAKMCLLFFKIGGRVPFCLQARLR